MSVVNVGTVERDDVIHFFLDSFPHGFDAEHGEYFDDVVRVRSHRIHVPFGQDTHQRGTVCF